MAEYGENSAWTVNQKRRLPAKLLCAIAFAALSFCGFGEAATAQLTPDNTLGNESSRVNRNTSLDITGEITGDRIEGGAVRGNNLFHSFRDFNVERGQRVYFSNPNGIDNIISRVTGGRLSNIQGTLGVLGNANLFLLNPSGMIFGPNARLDVRGSFVASTADRLVFADGIGFSAANPSANPVLTVSVPIGLQYGGASGSIRVETRQSNQSGIAGGLTVSPGRTLALVGGSIDLVNGNLTAPGGRIELGSVQDGLVSLIPVDVGFALDYSQVESFRNIRLLQQSIVGGTDQASREIQVQSNRLTLADNSQISTTTANFSPGGNLTVNAAETIELRGSVTGSEDAFTGLVADSESFRRDAGNAGNIAIATRRLLISDGAQITSFTNGGGDGGNIAIRASDLVRLTGGTVDLPSGITTGTRSEGNDAGRAGNVRIETDRLSLRAGAQIFSITFGAGDAGNVAIDALNAIDVVGSKEIQQTNGDSADNEVRLPGADPRRSSSPSLIAAQSQGAGAGGNLTLNTGQLSLQNSGQVATTAFAAGDAGNIEITATDSIDLGGRRSPDRFSSSGIFAQVDVGASGNGGNITLNTGRLTLRNGTRVSAGTIQDSTGNGGTLTVFADLIRLGGSNLFLVPSREQPRRIASALSSESRGAGRAGNLTVRTTGELTARNRAEVSVRSLGQQAQAGNLTIRAGSIGLDSGAQVVAETESGDGGNIVLQSQDTLILRNGSRISTTAGRAGVGGSGGNINIAADFVIAAPDENSDITANAFRDRGGRVEITAEDILGLTALSLSELESRLGTRNPNDLNPENLFSSDITAISQSGNPRLSGQIIFNTPDIDPSRGLAELPTEVVDASQLIAQSCTPGGRRIARRQGSFVVTGRSGLPDRPEDFLRDGSGLTHWITLDPEPDAQRQTIGSPSVDRDRRNQNDASDDAVTPGAVTPESTQQIVEAQGWIVNSQGEVVLVANPLENPLEVVPQRSQAIHAPCSPELSSATRQTVQP